MYEQVSGGLKTISYKFCLSGIWELMQQKGLGMGVEMGEKIQNELSVPGLAANISNFIMASLGRRP